MIIGTMITVAPLFWFTTLGAMGLAAGSIVGHAFGNLMNVGERAGAAGPELGIQLAKTVVGKFIPGPKK
jgi:hypothetical protein